MSTRWQSKKSFSLREFGLKVSAANSSSLRRTSRAVTGSHPHAHEWCGGVLGHSWRTISPSTRWSPEPSRRGAARCVPCHTSQLPPPPPRALSSLSVSQYRYRELSHIYIRYTAHAHAHANMAVVIPALSCWPRKKATPRACSCVNCVRRTISAFASPRRRPHRRRLSLLRRPLISAAASPLTLRWLVVG